MSKFYVVSTGSAPVEDGDATLSVVLVTTNYELAIKRFIKEGKIFFEYFDEDEYENNVEKMEDDPMQFWLEFLEQNRGSVKEGFYVGSHENHPEDARLQCYTLTGHDIIDLSVQRSDQGPIIEKKEKNRKRARKRTQRKDWIRI